MARLTSLFCAAAFAFLCGGAARAQHVLTQHNDNARTGATLRETTLSTTNVNVATFGKVFTRTVDGYLYAQPLYVQSLPIPGKGLHNVIFAATSHNSVYAYDADDPKADAPLWKVTLGPAVPAAEIYTTHWTDMRGEIGITSTPVIDLPAQTIYVETKNKENNTYVQRLHALNIETGQERHGSPVLIKASVKGTGDGNVNGIVSFNPVTQLNRPGLLLSNGVVYLAYGSHADQGVFHGWILGYDARTLAQRCVFNTTPNGSDGAIWQAGMGMAADSTGAIFAMTGNGTFNADTHGSDYGDTILKLRPSGNTLLPIDYFTPYNQASLSANDTDMGASGPLLVPGTSLLLGGGKNGWLYLTHQDNLGHYQSASDSQISQSFQITQNNIHGSPVFWHGPAGPMTYVWGEFDHLKAFKFDGAKLVPKPDSQSPLPVPDGMPGGFLSVSANGGKAGTGIVWACTPYDANANWDTVPGVLRAYDASNLAREIWDSKINAARDDVGMFAKFCAPTIANGKVYASTFSNQLQVYGLLDGTLPTIDKLSANRGHLVVHYTKPVESLSASRCINYALDNGVRVLRASLDGSDKQTVYLATSPLRKGTLYTLTAQSVRDRANLKAILPAATHAWVRL